MDEKGKLVAKRSGIGNAEKDKQTLIRSEATQYILHKVSVCGTIIRWMRREIYCRIDLMSDTFDSILYPNPFVPESRIIQFRQGFLRGLAGDWISSISILVPQLENSLRTLLGLSGIDVVSVDNEGVQQEKDLNALIYEKDFERLFGEDMTFQLQVILTEKAGFNLRNRVAHGLVPDSLALSDIGPMVWSMSLLLCIRSQQMFTASSEGST